MKNKIAAPEEVPENGFYYHYKHDPDGAINNYAYEVIGVGRYTEDECFLRDMHMVVYRPLYEDAPVYQAGKLFDLRPLEMFIEYVTKSGKTFPRFKKITDAAVIKELEKIRARMYDGRQR
jgi:hypothetical protein